MSLRIASALFVFVGCSLVSAQEKSVEVQANKAFLRWKSTAPASPLSESLRELLRSDKALTFLSEAAVGPSEAFLNLRESREAISVLWISF